MIVYPIAFPSIAAPRLVRLRDWNTVGVTTSPFSKTDQVQEHQGQRWEFDLEFAPMRQSVGLHWESFFRKLRGQAGTFLMTPPDYEGPFGTAADTPGVPEVDGGGQTGLTLAIKTGLVGPIEDYLLAGDLLSIGAGDTRVLHAVTADVDLVGDGTGTVDIWPRLRYMPLDGADIDVATPSGRFRLTAPGVQIDKDPARNYLIASVPIVEAL